MGLNANQFTSTALLSARQITSTTTGAAVDVTLLKGKGKVVLNCGAATAGTSPTCTVKLTHAATSGGSYSDVPGGAFTAVTDAAASVQQKFIDFDSLHPFVKVVATVGGTDTPTFPLSVTAESLTN